MAGARSVVPFQVAAGVYLVAVGRGALAANVYLVQNGATWTLVDTAWAGSAAVIRKAAETLFGPGARPADIVLTHIHPDHSGAAGELARSWDVPVYVHPDEMPMAAGRYLPRYANPLDRWVVAPAMNLLPAKTRERIEAAGSIADVVRPLAPGAPVPELPEWECVSSPGHTPGHVALFRRGDGVLIAGDAILTVDLNSVSDLLIGRRRLAGPPRYTTWDWPEALRSIGALADVKPRILAPGHGRPVTTGTTAAIRTLAEHLQARSRGGRLGERR